MDFSLPGLTTPLQILLVDLMLGADNALMIGLAARSLAPEQRRRATVIGIGAAVVLRLLMSVVATSLLGLPFVKLVGALLLAIIALNLTDEDDAQDSLEGATGDARAMWAAAAVIVVADATMSVDNVIALAAIAKGSYLWLFIGVALSLPMLGYGGMMAAEWLRRAPGLVALGAAMLGWIAGEMAVSDPLWAAWVETNAPGLAALAPPLTAAFVYLYGWIAPRPAPRPKLARPSPSPRPSPVAKPALASRPRLFTEARLMIGGMLLLALVAGAFLAFVTFYGGME